MWIIPHGRFILVCWVYAIFDHVAYLGSGKSRIGYSGHISRQKKQRFSSRFSPKPIVRWKVHHLNHLFDNLWSYWMVRNGRLGSVEPLAFTSWQLRKTSTEIYDFTRDVLFVLLNFPLRYEIDWHWPSKIPNSVKWHISVSEHPSNPSETLARYEPCMVKSCTKLH